MPKKSYFAYIKTLSQRWFKCKVSRREVGPSFKGQLALTSLVCFPLPSCHFTTSVRITSSVSPRIRLFLLVRFSFYYYSFFFFRQGKGFFFQLLLIYNNKKMEKVSIVCAVAECRISSELRNDFSFHFYIFCYNFISILSFVIIYILLSLCNTISIKSCL